MTSFFIPQLGSQIYTMKGMANRLYLEADELGEYRGIAAHYNGEGFSDMHFQTYAVTEKEYEDYIKTSKSEESVLDFTAYDEIRSTKASAEPKVFGNVSRNLFMNIVMDNIPNDSKPEITATQ